MHATAATLLGSRPQRLAWVFLGLSVASVMPGQTTSPAPVMPPGAYGYGGNGRDPSGFRSSYDQGNFPPAPQVIGQPHRMMVYFPPLPPRLETHVDLPSIFEAKKPAPDELMPFVNEPFYAPLSTRLAESTLSERQRQRLNAYLTAKLRLQNELRSKLADVATANSAERQAAYAELARTEDPQIEALEQTAQLLRNDLIRGELFQNNVDWNGARVWRVGTSNFRSSIDAMAAQFQLMRGAAFYQKGLSGAQRRLLLEVGMELGEMPIRSEESGELTPDTTPTDTNPPLFFSPETSRIHLPVDLPPELSDKIAKYERDKSALKKELHDIVYREDSAYFDFARTHAAVVLAQQQEPRIAALENLAEEIRRGLATLPNPPRPPDPPDIPPAVADRIADFMHDKVNVQRDLVLLLTNARRTLEIQRVGYSKNAEGKPSLNLAIRPWDRNEVQIRKLQANFAVFNQTSAARSADLQKKLTDIRKELATVIGAGTGPGGEKAIDRFLTECVETIEQREDWERYRDYRIAVLEPGLSPLQRRLLFDAALVDLNLPLPGLERGPAETGLDQQAFYGGRPNPIPAFADSPRGP